MKPTVVLHRACAVRPSRPPSAERTFIARLLERRLVCVSLSSQRLDEGTQIFLGHAPRPADLHGWEHAASD
jgi:hypothetical protein